MTSKSQQETLEVFCYHQHSKNAAETFLCYVTAIYSTLKQVMEIRKNISKEVFKLH